MASEAPASANSTQSVSDTLSVSFKEPPLYEGGSLTLMHIFSRSIRSCLPGIRFTAYSKPMSETLFESSDGIHTSPRSDEWQATMRHARAYFLHGQADCGIGFNFGSDVEAFADAVDVLQLDALVRDDTSPVDIHNLIASGEIGTTHMMGGLVPLARQIPLVDTLKALQIAGFTRTDHNTITQPSATSARIILGHMAGGSTNVMKPVAVLGVEANNTPGISETDHYTGEEYLTEDLAQLDDDPLEGEELRDKFTKLARAVIDSEYSLVVPWHSYYIAIGRASMRLIDISSANVHQWHDMSTL